MNTVQTKLFDCDATEKRYHQLKNAAELLYKQYETGHIGREDFVMLRQIYMNICKRMYNNASASAKHLFEKLARYLAQTRNHDFQELLAWQQTRQQYSEKTIINGLTFDILPSGLHYIIDGTAQSEEGVEDA